MKLENGNFTFETGNVKLLGSDMVARFFSAQHTKTGKNVPKRGEIYQMAIKYAK
jgi:hypothetical protein